MGGSGGGSSGSCGGDDLDDVEIYSSVVGNSSGVGLDDYSDLCSLGDSDVKSGGGEVTSSSGRGRANNSSSLVVQQGNTLSSNQNVSNSPGDDTIEGDGSSNGSSGGTSSLP